MGFEHKPNSGSIFPNDYKERDGQPDHTGSAMIDGVEYRIAGWINEGREKEYISLKFETMADYKAKYGNRGGVSSGGRDAKTRAAEPAGYRERADAAITRAKQRMSNMSKRGEMPDPDPDFSGDDIPF